MAAFSTAETLACKLICDFLRDLALDCEQISQIPIVFLRPNVSVGARINQLGV